jgi:hypothetical protein
MRLRSTALIRAIILSAGFIPGLASRLACQNPPQVPPPGKAPNPQLANPQATEKHRRLAFLAGSWEEEITYADAKPDEAKSTGRWTARPALGLYLNIQYRSGGPRGPYRAFAVLTYDTEQNRYRMWWFDDAGGIGEFSGDFTDSNSLVMEHAGTSEGKPFRERFRYTRVSATEVQTSIEQSWDNGPFKLYLQAVAHRAGDAAAPPRPPRR